ncbi:MAG: hypothetical protein K2G55_17690 [Lachnospiraceae bacterium]|nr:hypothetical protein [Lachnospiraceae bacterium]MDE7201240.1 hypothetical protein [Lachnospiraceae bacterium]
MKKRAVKLQNIVLPNDATEDIMVCPNLIYRSKGIAIYDIEKNCHIFKKYTMKNYKKNHLTVKQSIKII